MTPTWRPSEIIINEAVREDPVTKHILSQCPNVPVFHTKGSTSSDVKKASKLLSEATQEMLPLILAGKQVMYISPPGNNFLDTFEIEDKRLMCPEFDRLKLAYNGCYYNCDWCFLKATYRARQNYITVYVQYEKMKGRIAKKLETADHPIMFNTGELADSLSMDHLTYAAQEFIPWFGEQGNGYLYMLTKSDNVDHLLKLKHNGHTILTWSLNTDPVSRQFELRAPDFSARLKAAKKAQEAGYRVRVRLDPIVPIVHWEHHYTRTIERILQEIKPERITLGTLRFEEQFYKIRKSLISNKLLLTMMDSMVPVLGDLQDGSKSVGKYSFRFDARVDLFRQVISRIKEYSDCDIALCKESKEMWDAVGLDLKDCKCACKYDGIDMTKEREAITVTKETKPAKKTEKKASSPTEETPFPLLPDASYESRQLYQLEIKYLIPDPNQPRKSIDGAELKELKASIEKHGLLHPIWFRKTAEGHHIIVSGERRYRASLLAKKDTIPAFYTDGNSAEIALVENLLRVDLTAIEEAEALQHLKNEQNYTNKDLANVIGKAESTISEILKLNQLPQKIRDQYRTDKALSKRRLLEVAKADSPEEMKKQFKKLLKEASRDELRQERTPRHREIDAVFKTMIGGLKTKLSGTDFSNMDAGMREDIQKELNDLVGLIDEKLGNA